MIGSASTHHERAERAMALLLRLGVITAACIVFSGGAGFLTTHGMAAAGFESFRGEPAALRALPGILEGAMRFDARSVIMLGLLVLIATPIARVTFSVVTFIIERDVAFVTITLVVLAILVFGLIGHTA